MKICIYGAGAIIGTHLAAIQQDGLKVLFKDGTHKHQRMTATDNPADLGPQGRFMSTRLSRPEVESAAA